MATSSIGTITLVVSENHRDNPSIKGEEAPQVVEEVLRYFNYLLAERGLDEEYSVTNVEWSMGCITIVLTIGTIAKLIMAGGGVAAGVKILKDYKDGREGLTKVLEDLKNVKMWFKKKWTKKKSSVPDPQPETSPDPFKVIFEQMVSTYEGLPPEQRKYWAAGQHMTVMDEKGDYCHYTVSLKREDLHAPHEEEPLKKQYTDKTHR